MSSIIFNRLSRNLKPNGVGVEEEEEEEEQPSSFANEFESPNYEVHLYKNLKNTNRLINVIVHELNMDYVVIKVKKEHEYSFGVKHFSENKVHYTNNVYCEDKFILSYIDNGEIPPLLTEIIDEWWCPKRKDDEAKVNSELDEAKSKSSNDAANSHPINHYSNVYYNGCILAEIRNHRLPSKNSESFQSYFILLKPSRLSYQNEINRIVLSTSPKFKWNEKAVRELESNIIYANAPKLYLGLNPNVYSLAKKFARRKDILCDNQFVRMRRKRLKRSFPLGASESSAFKLLNFIKANPRPKMATSQIPSNAVNDHQLFKSYEFKDILKISSELAVENDFSDELIQKEEHILEHLDGSKCARLIIFQRPIDDTYYGTLLHNKTSECKKPDFYLGSQRAKNLYVDQYIDQYTENENKLMRIITQIDNEPRKERFTLAVSILQQKRVQQQLQVNKQSQIVNQQIINALQKKSNLQQILCANNLIQVNSASTDDVELNLKTNTGNQVANLLQGDKGITVGQQSPIVAQLNAPVATTLASLGNDHKYQLEPISVTYRPGSTIYTVRPVFAKNVSKQNSQPTLNQK